MTDTERAVFRIHIKGSIDDVWREITKTDEPQGCMFNMILDTPGLAPGAPIRMRTLNGKYTGVVGEVLEFEPPHRYAHTFKFTRYDDPPCTIIYELKEVNDGVEFIMTAEDIPAGTKTAKDIKGGEMIVKTLKAIVEQGQPPLGTRMFYGFFKLFEPVLYPKRTLSRNWP